MTKKPFLQRDVENHCYTLAQLNEEFVGLAVFGDLAAMKYLVEESGFDIDVHHRNNSAFEMAAFSGHIDIIKYLHEDCQLQISDNDYDAFRWAAANGHLELVKYLVEDSNEEINLRVRDCEAVFKATRDQRYAVVDYFFSDRFEGIYADQVVRLIASADIPMLQYFEQLHPEVFDDPSNRIPLLSKMFELGRVEEIHHLIHHTSFLFTAEDLSEVLLRNREESMIETIEHLGNAERAILEITPLLDTLYKDHNISSSFKIEVKKSFRAGTLNRLLKLNLHSALTVSEISKHLQRNLDGTIQNRPSAKRV